MTTTPTTADTLDATVHIPICDAVRLALVDLLTIGQHHHAATPATLTAVGATRRELEEPFRNPVSHYTTTEDRLAGLTSALGDIGGTLLEHHPSRPHTRTRQLRAGLTTLAAIALAWLDTLPTPTDENNDPRENGDPEPF